MGRQVANGFSLVELMVAMVISLFLTLGLFSLFGMSATNVTTTGQYNQLQENGRIALSIMTPDIAQASFFGDVTGTDFVLNINTQNRDNVNPDCIGGGLNNATLPNAQPAHFRRIWGYEAGVSSQSASCITDAMAGTDVIQLKRLVGPAGASSGFRAATTNSQAIFFSANGNNPNLVNQRVWEYQHHLYYIAAVDGIPVLNRRSLSASGMNNYEQLVEGIENIRFLYGFDADGDDAADSFLPVQSVTTMMWDNETFQRIVAVKIFLLVRTTTEDASYRNDVVYRLGDKSLGPFNDHFRRKLLSTTVLLENPVLIRN